MKKIFKIMTLALVGVFALASCGDDVPAPNPNPNPGGGDEPSTEVVDITCAQAVELCAALADNASSAETYAITGYITDVIAKISNGQQSFWLSDNNDGQKMVQAFYANLPEGVEKFVAGSKVKITGKLIKYVKGEGVEAITEVKNADVEILEAGTDTPNPPAGEVQHITIAEFLSKADTQTTYELTGIVKNIVNTTYGNFDLVEGDATIFIYGLLDKEGNAKNFANMGISEGDEVTLTGVYVDYNGTAEIKNAQFVSLKKGEGTGEEEETPSEDNTFAGADATVVMSEAYSECTDGNVDATPITFDAVQVSFDKNGGNNVPKYYWNANADFRTVRMYAMNAMTVTSDKQIAKIVIKCAAPGSGKNYNGNDEMTTTAGSIEKANDKVTIVVDGINQKEVTITNDFTQDNGGTQLRIHSMGVYYVK